MELVIGKRTTQHGGQFFFGTRTCIVYLEWAVEVRKSIPNNRNCQESETEEQPGRETEVVQHAVEVADTDHDDCEGSLGIEMTESLFGEKTSARFARE